MIRPLVLALILLCADAAAADLRNIIEGIKPSVVGIGNFQRLRSPPVVFVGTGFAVGDGLSIITAAHVVQDLLNHEGELTLGVLLPQGELAQFRPATITAFDRAHDLVRLHITGTPLPALPIGDSDKVAEGTALAFTGFPLGMALGLHPATHRCMLAAITPLAGPAVNSSRLDAKLAHQLNQNGYTVFQLDGTAYPGNSGSPLFDAETGQVIGVINMVYVKGLKEAALSAPSGISYAVPARYLAELMRR